MAVNPISRKISRRCGRSMNALMIVVASIVGFAPVPAGIASEMRELSDEELDLVSAGTASVDSTDELASFSAMKTTRLGKTIIVDGSYALVDVVEQTTIGSLTLTDSAQSNLQSLININAVNSQVNVLLNLNINIDSSVGTLHQFNVNGIIPALPDAMGN